MKESLKCVSRMPFYIVTHYIYLSKHQTSFYYSGKQYLSSLSGLFAVICRQTNIVWVFMIAALAAGHTLTSEVKHHQVTYC